MYLWQRTTTPIGISLGYDKRDVGDPPIPLQVALFSLYMLSLSKYADSPGY